MADWSELPSELVQQICQKLNSELYLLRFRSVCSSWRRSSFVPNCHHNHLPSKLPHFPDEIEYIRSLPKQQNTFVMKPHYSWRQSCGPYCHHNHSPLKMPQFPDPYDRRHFKQNIFLIKPPATITQQQTLRPWLIRIGPDVYGKTQIWHPFDVRLRYPLFFAPCHFVHHLIDFNQLPVIDIGQMFYIYGPKIHIGKVVVATCEMGQPLALLTYDRFDVPTIFQCEDNSWRSIPTMLGFSWGNICLFKGQPCVADKNGRTLMIRENFNVLLLANPVFGGNVKFLVESECDLLLVDCYGIDSSPFDKDIRFDVFRLDEKEKKWVKLTTL
ncbi:F-box protein, partial [Trifolium pratense]